MRIVAIADLQIGESRCGTIDPTSGLHTREIDFFNSIDTVINFALDEKNNIDLVAILGDIYADRKPTMTQQREFAKRIARLSNAQKETIILQGNHDISEDESEAHTSSVIQEFDIPYVSVVDEPKVLHYNETAVIAVPYLSRKRLHFRTLDEAVNHYKEIVEMLRSQSGKKNNVCLIHQTVENSIMPAGYRDLSTMDEIVVPLKLFDDFDITICGHIHKHQALQKKPPVLYVGSIDRVDFGEAKEEKGFVLYDGDKDKVIFAKLNVRDFLDLKVDVTNVENIQEKLIEDLGNVELEEKIVKLVVKVKESDVVKINVPDINKMLKKSFYSNGMSFDIVRERRTRDEKMSESLSLYSALESYIENRKEYKSIKDSMLKEGKTIIDEVKNDSTEIKTH